MLRVERRDVELTDEARLAALARPVLRD
jgi:hypothetical protein